MTNKEAARIAVDRLLNGNPKRKEVKDARAMMSDLGLAQQRAFKEAIVRNLAMERQPYTEADVLAIFDEALITRQLDK